ncbi:MAG: NAD-dependent epimerase/dehydratase family protein [Gammaproteobacteria bacterium]|nr:NAD-dependent epimerase/dehydratase family protein [Gammaproteobacteria bacterium]
MLSKNNVVLVTGGTGFTGAVLVRKLCETGCEVRVIARASSNRSDLQDLDIKWIEGNVYDPQAVAAAAHNVDYIFHVAAAYREAKIEDEVYQLVHVNSTRLLTEAALKNPSFKRFIHISTVGVLGHIDKPPADESTPYNPGDMYQETKTTAEKWLLDFARDRDLPITIIRPAAIYGPGDRRLLKVFKMAKLPIVPLLGFTRGLYHLIHVDDLVQFMIHVADHPNTKGQVYICGNPQATSIKDIIRVVGEYFGKQPRFLRLPAWPFFLLGHLCETICKPLNIEPPIYPRRVAFFTKDRSFDTSKMRRDTDFQYKYTNEDGLRATAEWYRQNNWL